MANSSKIRDEAGRPSAQRPPSRLAELATRRTTRRQRRVWTGRVGSWDQHGSAGLTRVTAAVLNAAVIRTGDVVIDLGCGTGQLSIPLAMQGARVLAVDVSPGMAGRLRTEGRRRGLDSLEVIALPIEELDFPAGSADLVVSSYALHHLRDADKARLVHAAARWLRPGGQILIADMMFGRGGSPRDREIIRTKLGVLLRKGPGGWWRIAKNAVRYLARVQECPIPMEEWTSIMQRAGLSNIAGTPIVAEAALVSAQRPGSTDPVARPAARLQAGRP